MIGIHLSHYLIESELGRGGMGTGNSLMRSDFDSGPVETTARFQGPAAKEWSKTEHEISIQYVFKIRHVFNNQQGDGTEIEEKKSRAVRHGTFNSRTENRIDLADHYRRLYHGRQFRC